MSGQLVSGQMLPAPRAPLDAAFAGGASGVSQRPVSGGSQSRPKGRQLSSSAKESWTPRLLGSSVALIAIRCWKSKSSSKHTKWFRRLARRVQREEVTEGVQTSSEEELLWKRAFDLEKERAELLQACSKVLGLTVGDVGSVPMPSLEDPPGGWKVAFEMLREQNVVAERQLRNRATGEEEHKPVHQDAAAPATVQDAAPPVVEPVPEAQIVQTPQVTEAKTPEGTVEYDETSPKVFTLFNLPKDRVKGQVAEEAIDVVSTTEFPALAPFFGIATSKDQMPSLFRVEQVLGFCDAKSPVRELFKMESSRSIAGRVCEISGRFRPPVPGEPPPPEQLLTLLQQRLTADRHAGSPAMPPLELFLQPSTAQGDALLFVFLAKDLPDPSERPRAVLLSRLTGLLTVLLCNSRTLSVVLSAEEPLLLPPMLPVEDFIDIATTWLNEASAIWPVGGLLLLTLLSSLAARRGAASFHGVEITQVALPSIVAGHLGSVWLPKNYLPSLRANFDIAAAAPTVSLLLSILMTAYGASKTASLGSSNISVLQVPAIELPAVLAMMLGYRIPVPGEEPLLTLASADLSSLPNPGGPLVPVDAFLLCGSLGLAAAAANLLPVGGFDGFQLVRAAFGARTAIALELVALIGLCIEVGRDDTRGLFASEVVLMWLLQGLLGNRRDENMPPRDAVTAMDDGRKLWAVVLVASSAVILMPQDVWSALQPTTT